MAMTIAITMRIVTRISDFPLPRHRGHKGHVPLLCAYNTHMMLTKLMLCAMYSAVALMALKIQLK